MRINGVNLNVKTQGDGPSFIWGHGLTANMALDDVSGWFQWDRQANAVRVIRYDARGHGQSEGSHEPEDYVWSKLDSLLPNSRLVIAQGMEDVSTWPQLMQEFISSLS